MCAFYDPAPLGVPTTLRSRPIVIPQQQSAMFEGPDPLVLEAAPRNVEYVRHEFRHPPERVSASLLAFVYDVPYLAACGVLPPLDLLNERLLSGGEEGGMTPGATGEPFQVSSDEYTMLLAAIADVPISQIRPNARYAFRPYTRDPPFDSYQGYIAWLTAVCDKHRASWHADLRHGGFMT
jgi:hypothetical protein